jgi:alpha-acetolactate decarboxylase
VKYVSVAAVLIVGIIFGTMTFKKMLEHGFFDVVE